MSQNTLVIADGTGAQVLERMNNSNNTLATLNSGSAAPATTYAYMLWADTTNNQLKMRNAANTGWNVVGSFDATSFYASVADASITEAKIATGAVTVNKIGALAVTDAKLASNSVTTAKILDANVTPAKLSQKITRTLLKSGTSTSVEFTGIPSWVTKVTLNMQNAGSNGTSTRIVKLGTSIDGYSTIYSGSADMMGSAVGPHYFSSGFDWSDTTANASDNVSGTYTFTKLDSIAPDDSVYWIGTVVGANISGSSTSALLLGSGYCKLRGELDRLMITSVGGTNTMEGSYSIIYE